MMDDKKGSVSLDAALLSAEECQRGSLCPT